jgi:hypothetical protein
MGERGKSREIFKKRMEEIKRLQIIQEQKMKEKLIEEREEENKKLQRQKDKLELKAQRIKQEMKEKNQKISEKDLKLKHIPYFIEAFTIYKGIKYNPKNIITKVLIDYINHNQFNYEDKNLFKLIGEYLEFIRYRGGGIILKKDDIAKIKIYLKNIKKRSTLITLQAESNNKKAIKVIESYEFFRICPGDGFGFILAIEAYNSWVGSQK